MAVVFLSLLAGSITAVVLAVEKREMEKVQEEQKYLEECYYKQNIAFGLTKANFYVPYHVPYEGTESSLFYDLEMYRMETGEELTLEEVWDYFSRTYDEGLAPRIYPNHEKIARYVEFMYNFKTTFHEKWRRTKYYVFNDKVSKIEKELYNGEYAEYIRNIRGKRIELPFELVTEIVKKAYNPDYEIKLPLENEQYYQHQLPEYLVQIYEPIR